MCSSDLPLVLAVHLGEDGTVRWIEGTCEEGGGSRGNWGLRVPRMMILSDPSGARYEVSTPRLVDDAPFYARFPLMTPNGRGWGERVRPGGIGRWWMRPFVGMRVVGPSRSSLWTPLFVGTEQDRLRRLGRWWVG